MFYRSRHFALGVVVGLSLVVVASPVAAECTLGFDCVNLEFRPSYQEGCPDDVVLIGLYAVSDSVDGQAVQSMTVLLWWDEDRLELLGNIDNGPYDWLRSEFPDDSELDNMNGTWDDGDAYYWALSYYSGEVFQATPGGELVTSFRFRKLGVATGSLAMLDTYGDHSTTHVVSGTESGRLITGTLGAASVGGCQAPTVRAEGGRYLAVTPSDCDAPVALLVTGNSGDPDVACIRAYVQADGTLGPTPVTLTPTQWGGTVHVSGGDIVPSKTYNVQAECGTVETVLSAVVTGTTWQWGDVNNATEVDLDDIIQLLDAYQNIFVVGTLENSDLYGQDQEERCGPDGRIDLDDILSVLDAYQLRPYPCSDPC